MTQIDRPTHTGQGQAGTQTDTRKIATKTACHTKKPGETPIDPFPWAESPDDKLRDTAVQGQEYRGESHTSRHRNTHINSVRPSTNARIPAYDHRRGDNKGRKGAEET